MLQRAAVFPALAAVRGVRLKIDIVAVAQGWWRIPSGVPGVGGLLLPGIGGLLVPSISSFLFSGVGVFGVTCIVFGVPGVASFGMPRVASIDGTLDDTDASFADKTLHAGLVGEARGAFGSGLLVPGVDYF